MDLQKIKGIFDKETLNKLSEVITPISTRDEIAQGIAKLGVQLSEEQLNSICDFIATANKMTDIELEAITGGKTFLYRGKNANPVLATDKKEQSFELFLNFFKAVFCFENEDK